MSLVSNFFRLLSTGQILRKSSTVVSCTSRRYYADKPKTEETTKTVVVQGTEKEERVRVRRARPADVPRVLRFVREHARAAWPGLAAPPAATHLVLGDYVARALAQGHSMLAEQYEGRRGWSQIRGVALGTVVCPWDAPMLDRWARCVRCTRSRRLMHFTAHCLRAPALHDKYRVHNILQVILIVPTDTPKNAELIQILAKSAIQRGKDVGFPLLRFDVTNNTIAKSLEDLKLKKEWQLSYDALPEIITEKDLNKPFTEKMKNTASNVSSTADQGKQKENFISVYTALTQNDKKDIDK